MGWLGKIKETFLPFQAIATELRILRELYELELRDRPNPIIRITEAPSPNDTEVMYGEEDIGPKAKLKKMMDSLTGDSTDDDDSFA